MERGTDWLTQGCFLCGRGATARSSAFSTAHSLQRVTLELIRAKTAANRRPKYVKGLALYLRAFMRGRENLPVSRICVSDLEDWFLQRREAPSTQASNMGRLSALFAFAVRRGYMADNPVKRLELVTVERAAPRILSPMECRRALSFVRWNIPRFIPWMALALFAGIRPEEIDRLTWADVDLERGAVTINAAASKVRRRRVTPLTPAAVAWLRLGGDLAIPYVSRRRYIRRVRNHLGLSVWPQDVLRHTAATYWLHEHGDAGKVALWLGNSARILLAHYRELVSEADAGAFWAIRPESSQMELWRG